MRPRIVIIAAGLTVLGTLGGCAEPGYDGYAYDSYGRPYYAGSYYGSRWDNGPPARWNYRDNSWYASRWDSHPYDRYARYYNRYDERP
jgi:hypothetical protein